MDESKLFSGLESYGFKEITLNKVTLYEKKEPVKATDAEKTKTFKIEDFIYLKEIHCPVCKKTFHERIVKKSKLRIIRTDPDLKPIYENMNPLPYDVVICQHCGYASLGSTFNKIWGRSINSILDNITPQFKYKEYPLILSNENGVERYKLALLNSVVKKAKDSEKAYICMKTAWLYRDIGDRENELLFMKSACDGFITAYQKESFPIYGNLSEHTTAFLIASFLKELGDYDNSMRWIAPIIISKQVREPLKNRAIDLKYELQNIKAQQSADA